MKKYKEPSDDLRQVTFKLTGKEVKKIDGFAKDLRLNRSQILRNLTLLGLEDAEILKSTGILALTLKGVDIFSIIRKALKNKNFEVDSDNKLIIDL